MRRLFWRWVRDEYGLSHEVATVDENREFTDNEEEAFVGLFMPEWNAGRLDVKYYHDGRRFFYGGVYYTQFWDNAEMRFFWIAEDGPKRGQRLYENPQPSAAEIAAKIAAAARAKVTQNSKKSGKLVQQSLKNARRKSVAQAKKTARRMSMVGLVEQETHLMNLGFSRSVARKAYQLAPRDVDERVSIAIELKEKEKIKKAEWKRRLKENPPPHYKAAFAVAAGARNVLDLVRFRRRQKLTEEQQRAAQLNELRKQLYGSDGRASVDDFDYTNTKLYDEQYSDSD